MRKVHLVVKPHFDRCMAATVGDTTWVWIRGGHVDLDAQMAQLDALLTEEEKQAIRVAYGWDAGDKADVLATPVDYVPEALRPPRVA